MFGSLRLWQDKDHDGISQPGELHTLTEMGVAGISVAYVADRMADEHGNSFSYRAAVYGTPGSTVGMVAWDVWLTGSAGSQPAAASASQGKGAAVTPAINWECVCECPLYGKPPQPRITPLCDNPYSTHKTWIGIGARKRTQAEAKSACLVQVWFDVAEVRPSGYRDCSYPQQGQCDITCLPVQDPACP